MRRYLALFLLLPTPLLVRPLSGGVQDTAGKPEPQVTREAVCRWADRRRRSTASSTTRPGRTAAVIDKFAAFWSKTALPRTTARGLSRLGRRRPVLRRDDDRRRAPRRSAPAQRLASGTATSSSCSSGPTRRSPRYYEFQANPKSVIFEMPSRRGRLRRLDQAGRPLGSKAVAVLDGTLDRRATATAAGPSRPGSPGRLSPRPAASPSPGAAWPFALCRYDYGPEGTQPVLMSSPRSPSRISTASKITARSRSRERRTDDDDLDNSDTHSQFAPAVAHLI